MAGSSNYPGALDDFSAQSPTNLGDDDSTGRTHSERHDDLEAAMEAVQGELGVNPSGASASTVAVRFVALDSAIDGKVSASIVTASAQVLVGAASSSVAALSSGSAGQVLTVSGSATYGLAWLDPAGGATVEMSPTEPVSPDNGTLWVDTDSDIPTFTASAYVQNSLFANKGTIAAASAASTPAALSVGSNGQMLMADSSATAGLRYVDPPANRNLIINGAMNVHQRGTSTAGIATGYYTADRWDIQSGGTQLFTQSIETDAPTGSGFNKSLKMLVTTANAAPSAGNFQQFITRLEGQDLQRIKKGTSSAEQLTLSFWVKSNATGTYVFELLDSDNARRVCASYSISSSATWERKTITLPADTTGALNNDNGESLRLIWWLLAGTTFTSGALQTTWAANAGGDANRAVGQTNLAAATNNYWQVTGVQLETGPVATPFEFEPYEATLRKCQRYYWKFADGSSSPIAMGAMYSASALLFVMQTPVTMRIAPSLSATSGSNYYQFTRNGGIDEFDALALDFASTTHVAFQVTSGISGTAGHGGWVRTQNASASAALSAEL